MSKKQPQTEKTLSLNSAQLISKLKTAYKYKSMRISSVKIGGMELKPASFRGIVFKYKQ